MINHLQKCILDKLTQTSGQFKGKYVEKKKIPKIFALFKMKLLQSIIGEQSIVIDF